ncbi:MAG: hypothetical protein ACK5PS_13495 [Desulfopila sp.]
MTPYDEAHLFVAATRILTYQRGCAPQMAEICQMLGISIEAGLAQARKLAQANIVEIYQDPFSIKISVANHLAIEQLPQTAAPADSLTRELEQFMAKKKDLAKKAEAIQAELESRQKNMFKNIEEQLRKNIAKD